MTVRDGDVLVFGPLATPDNPFEISYRIVYAGPSPSRTPIGEHATLSPSSLNAAAGASQQTSSSSPIASGDANVTRKRKRTPSPSVPFAGIQSSELKDDHQSAGRVEETQHAIETSPAAEAAPTLGPISSLDESKPDVISTARSADMSEARPDKSMAKAAVEPTGSLAAPATSAPAATTLSAAALAPPSFVPDTTPATADSPERPEVAAFRAIVARKEDAELYKSYQTWVDFFSRHSREEYEAANEAQALKIAVIESEVAARQAPFRAQLAASSDADVVASAGKWSKFFERGSREEFEEENPKEALQIRDIEAEVAARERRNAERRAVDAASAECAGDTENLSVDAAGAAESGRSSAPPVGATTVEEDIDELMGGTDEALDDSSDTGTRFESKRARSPAGHEGPLPKRRRTSLAMSQDDSEFDSPSCSAQFRFLRPRKKQLTRSPTCCSDHGRRQLVDGR